MRWKKLKSQCLQTKLKTFPSHTKKEHFDALFFMPEYCRMTNCNTKTLGIFALTQGTKYAMVMRKFC